MTIVKQIATTIFTILVFILFSELLNANISILNFFKSTPDPTVREYLLPSYKMLSSACYNFDSQLKVYQDAVIFGDSELLGQVDKHVEQISRSLRYVISINSFSDYQIAEFKYLLKNYTEFTSTANKLYSNMSDGELNEDIVRSAQDISKKKDALRVKLNALSSSLYDELDKDIAAVNTFE